MYKTGEIIRELRINAGFTQKDLADALHVTDKAVSKWERGINLPDTNLLTKLSLLLDTDVEVLISKGINQGEWVGLIDIKDCDFSQSIYDKPLVDYLLIHYILLGISEIHILSEETNEKYLKGTRFKSLGFDFKFEEPGYRRMMIINHPWFIFGSDLTQQFRGAMLSQRSTKLVPENQSPVAFFSLEDNLYLKDRNRFIEEASERTLGRGMVCLDMDNNDKRLEVAEFVQTYQRNSGLLIADLEEVANRKVNQK